MKALNKRLIININRGLLYLLILTISACQQSAKGDPFAGCTYTEPEPIFSGSLRGVTHHDFQLAAQESTENIQFDDGLKLNIKQSGCDHRKQAFQFELSGAYTTTNSRFWVRQVVEQLEGLAALGPEFVVFEHWSEAIARVATKIKLSESTEIDEGFYVSVDRVLEKDHAILMLTLSDQP